MGLFEYFDSIDKGFAYEGFFDKFKKEPGEDANTKRWLKNPNHNVLFNFAGPDFPTAIKYKKAPDVIVIDLKSLWETGEAFPGLSSKNKKLWDELTTTLYQSSSAYYQFMEWLVDNKEGPSPSVEYLADNLIVTIVGVIGKKYRGKYRFIVEGPGVLDNSSKARELMMAFPCLIKTR